MREGLVPALKLHLVEPGLGKVDSENTGEIGKTSLVEPNICDSLALSPLCNLMEL